MGRPIREKLASGFQTNNLEVDTAWVNRLRDLLGGVTVQMQVNLGSTKILSRDLLALKPGDTIALHEDQDATLTVNTEGVPKFTGFLGSYRGNYALRIDKIIPCKVGDKNE